MKKHSGFTLVELMIVLAVAAMLAAFAAPSFRNIIMNNQLVGQANEFVAAIHLARSAAIKQQRNTFITSNAGTNWKNGWTVWQDNNSNDAQDAGEVLRVTQELGGDNTFTSAGKTQFRYSPSGIVDGVGTLTLCDDRTGEQGRQITVSPAGRVNISTFDCP